MPAVPAALREFLSLSESTAEKIRTLAMEGRAWFLTDREKMMNLRRQPVPAATLRQQFLEHDLATRDSVASLLTARQKELLRRLGETMSPRERFTEAACFYLLPREVADKAPPVETGGGAPLQKDTPVTEEFTCPPLPAPKRLIPQ